VEMVSFPWLILSFTKNDPNFKIRKRGERGREPRPTQPQTAHNKAITTRWGGRGNCGFGKLAHHGDTLSRGIRGRVTTHTYLFPLVGVIIPFVV